MGAAAERLYANTGHLFDFANKALELSEHLGGDAARDLLPLLTLSLTQVRGEEESTGWRHPIEIVELLRALEDELPGLLDLPRDAGWSGESGLADTILGPDPHAILDALRDALAGGASPERLAAVVAYCAAMRMARFASSNEVTDWFSVQHTLNFTAAVHRAVQRSASADVVRAIFHGAIAVYMNRYLNVPPARLPGERGGLDTLPTSASEITDSLLASLDQRAGLDAAAALVSRYLQQGHALGGLIDVLAFATVREDLGLPHAPEPGGWRALVRRLPGRARGRAHPGGRHPRPRGALPDTARGPADRLHRPPAPPRRRRLRGRARRLTDSAQASGSLTGRGRLSPWRSRRKPSTQTSWSAKGRRSGLARRLQV